MNLKVELHEVVAERLSNRLAYLLECRENGGELFSLAIQFSDLAEDAQMHGLAELAGTAAQLSADLTRLAWEGAPKRERRGSVILVKELDAFREELWGAREPSQLLECILTRVPLLPRSELLERAQLRLAASVTQAFVATYSSNADDRRKTRVDQHPERLDLILEDIHESLEISGFILLQGLKAVRATRRDVENVGASLADAVPIGKAQKVLFGRAVKALFNLDMEGVLAFGIPVFEALVRALATTRGKVTLLVRDSSTTENTLGPLLSFIESNGTETERDLAFTARVILTEQQGHNLRNDHCHGLLREYNTCFAIYFGGLLLKLAHLMMHLQRSESPSSASVR